VNNIQKYSITWFSSKETKTALKVSGCELMHLREKGELEFKKVGNAYFYKLPKSSLESNVSL
jgi:hypothetical protein